jgi:DNA-binding transcriptional LysR family regulator
VDIAVTEGFIHSPELSAEVFMEDELLPIVPVGHPLARKRRVELGEFCGHPLLMRETGSGTREVVKQALQERGMSVKPIMTLGSTEAIKRSVAAGVGVAFVSALTVQQEVADGRLAVVRVNAFAIRRPLHLVQARAWHLSAAARAFRDLLPDGNSGRRSGRSS